MKRLLIEGSVFATLVIVSNLLLLTALPPGRDTLLRAVVDKERLLREAPGPKIVFVGGSSLIFGNDSRAIDEALEGYAVVNAGLQGSVGLRYMLAQLEPHIGAGDLVVINPEYPQFLGMANGDDALPTLWQAHPEGRVHFRHPMQYWNLVRNLPIALANRVDGRIRNLGSENTVYRRSALDEYGDLISHLDRPGEDQSGKPLLPGYDLGDFDTSAVSLVNRFHTFCQRREARVVLIYPAISSHHAEQNADFLEAFHQRLNRETTVEIVAPPRASAQPDDHFFDTVYHLNATGRVLRSERLIAWLEAFLERSEGPGAKAD